MAPRRTPSVVNRSPQLAALDAEWQRVSRRPSSLRRARTWPCQVGDARAADALAQALRHATDLDDLVAATDRAGWSGALPVDPMAPVADPDEVLGALVVVARTDDLAARVVLHRIIPGVLASARRFRRTTYNDDYTDIAIGAAWLAIRSFDIDARRRHVAAALVSDVVWAGFRRASRRKAHSEVPTPNDVFVRRAADPAPVDPIVALAGTVRAAARAGIADDHLELIRELARTGSPSAVARDHAVTARTIRNRRDRATASIRAALGPDWYQWDDQLTAAA